MYTAFGTKPKLLAAVLDARIAGDDEPIPVAERPWVESLADAPDAAARDRAIVAAASAAIFARVAPVYDVMRGAASDRDVAALLESNRRGRREDQRRLAEILADAGHLNPDLDVDAAADVIYALANEDVFLLLTVDCGWDIDRYRVWLTAVLQEQLAARTLVATAPDEVGEQHRAGPRLRSGRPGRETAVTWGKRSVRSEGIEPPTF